jgi:hypothetical protein
MYKTIGELLIIVYCLILLYQLQVIDSRLGKCKT